MKQWLNRMLAMVLVLAMICPGMLPAGAETLTLTQESILLETGTGMEEPTPAPGKDPEQTQAPEATAEPEVTPEPEATAMPEATAEPQATAEPEMTAGPEATAEPQATQTPEPSEEPVETVQQDAFAAEDLTLGVKESAFLPLSNVPEGETLRYSSSNTRVCTVSSAGVLKGVAKGAATITVTASGGATATCTVTVVAAPNKITLNKTSATLAVGQTLDLDYTITQGSSATVAWTSNKKSVATVDSQGVVTAVGVGSATVTITTHNGKRASCKLTVKKAPGWIKAAEEEITLGAGQRVEELFTIESGSHTTLAYEYTVDEVVSQTCDIVRMENDVLVAAAPGIADVTATTHNGKTATVRVIVKAAPETIALSAENMTLGVKQTARLNVTLPENTAAEITYTSSKPKVAKIGADGNIQALKAGTTVITVRAHNGVTGTCTVTVRKAPGKIALDKSEVVLYPGMEEQLTYTLPSGTAASVTWKTGDVGVAEISADGKLTAVAPGTVTVTARTHNGKQDTLKVYVYSAPARLNLQQQAAEMGVGQKLTPVIDTDATHYRALRFTVSDSAVAKVSADGVLQAAKAGQATLRIETLDGALYAEMNVTVKAAPSKVTLAKTSVTMGVGDTYRIEPRIPDGTSTDFTFTRNSSRISVSDDGVVTANSVGSARVTVTAHNGKKAVLSVTVKKAPGWIRATQDQLTLGVGQQASGLFEMEKNTYTELTYAFSAEGVVRVENGKLIAAGTGETDVTATTHNGHSATVRVSVLPAPQEMTLSAERMDMGLKQKVQLGVTLPEGTAAGLTFTSSKPKIVSVDARGNLQALKVGTAVITVQTHNDVIRTCTVTVKKAPGKITLSGTEMTMYIGMTDKAEYTLPANTFALLTWSSSNAGVVSVAADGTMTAVAEGNAVITVRTHNGKSDTIRVYVYPAPTYMDLTQTSPMTMGVGQKIEIRPNTDASHYRMLEFASSNAAVVKISESGRMEAVKAGTATVTVRTLDSQFVRTLEITVYAAPRSLSLRQTKITMGVGESYTIEPVITANSYTVFTYLESNDRVTVTDDGVVTARAPGTAKVKVITHNGKTATLSITIAAQPASITLSENTLALDTGMTHQLGYRLPAGTLSKVTWTSDDPRVCTVSDSGLVTSVGQGRATITAATANGKTASCDVRVFDPAVSITAERSISLHVGETYDLEIDAVTASGEAYGGQITITPSDSKYVQIINGDVYGIQKGSCTLTVEASGQQATVQVTVLSDTNDSRRDIIVSSCVAKLGCKYVYANHGPDKFDCAGLVYYGYKQVGITLRYSAYAQGYQEGVQITKEQLLPGDIVCFNTNSTDSDLSDHTGIYIGDGKFVHASSGAGEVIISDLTTGYYSRTFVWGRRVLN